MRFETQPLHIPSRTGAVDICITACGGTVPLLKAHATVLQSRVVLTQQPLTLNAPQVSVCGITDSKTVPMLTVAVKQSGGTIKRIVELQPHQTSFLQVDVTP